MAYDQPEKSSRFVFKCDLHIVWVPKYRYCVLKRVIKELVDHDIRMLASGRDGILTILTFRKIIFYLSVSVLPKVSI